MGEDNGELLVVSPACGVKKAIPAPRAWTRRLILPALILLALFASRWLLAPPYLFYFDSANFALSIERFNPAEHQPQPPGYPMFVVLIRVLSWLIPDVQQVLVVAGILMGAAALHLLWLLGDRMFGRGAGVSAAVLLLFHPAFWFSGLTNQVRITLAVGACGIALLAWTGWNHVNSRRCFYAAAFLLGIAAGFRPAMGVFLAPLLLVMAIRGKRPLRETIAAGFLLASAVLLWLIPTAYASGGPSAYYELLRNYLANEAQGSSMVYGADAESGFRMARAAMVWNGIGVLSWIWALPFVCRRLRPAAGKGTALFLAIWFVPAFLFHALVHVGDPDHTLVTVPVLCLLGGWVLSSLRGGSAFRTAALWPAALIAAMALNVFLFFNPPKGLAEAAGHGVVKYVKNHTKSTFDALRKLRSSGPIYIVSYQSFITWRNISYYFPESTVLVLAGDYRVPGDPPASWIARNRRTGPVEFHGGEFVLPAEGKIVWVAAPELRRMLVEQAGFKELDPVVYLDARPGLRFQFGECRFTTDAPAAVPRP